MTRQLRPGPRLGLRLRLRLQALLDALWYGEYRWAWPLWPLLPPAWLFRGGVALRRLLYFIRVLPTRKASVPVIVVGNLSAGGCGKTPLVIWLSEHLRRRGYKPGIVSRGYGGAVDRRGIGRRRPQQARPDSNPYLVGDEPVLLATRSACPVAVARKRAQAARELAQYRQCDIVLCDDGLQHYGLRRDLEIAVIDGERRFGNGHGLPAGPLREPVSRLARCDLLVTRGEARRDERRRARMHKYLGEEFVMQYHAGPLKSLADDRAATPEEFRDRRLHAVAGIAVPERFFAALTEGGLEIHKHIFPDHHPYRQEDFDFVRAGDAIIMTEKDAVKCRSLDLANAWYMPIEARLAEEFARRFDHLLQEKING